MAFFATFEERKATLKRYLTMSIQKKGADPQKGKPAFRIDSSPVQFLRMCASDSWPQGLSFLIENVLTEDFKEQALSP